MKTQEEKLKSIIEKAVKNGFDIVWFNTKHPHDWFGEMKLVEWEVIDNKIWVKHTVNNHLKESLIEYDYATILFSHDFAKAFWGEEPYWNVVSSSEETEPTDGILRVVGRWQYHLQQAVLADEVIDYYYQFINKEGGETNASTK